MDMHNVVYGRATMAVYQVNVSSEKVPRAGIDAEQFLTPERSPILSFSACLAENPDALKLASHRPVGVTGNS